MPLSTVRAFRPSTGAQFLGNSLLLQCRSASCLPTSFIRSSSLSAIHRGLRRSEKARPQGPSSSRTRTFDGGERTLSPAAQRMVETRREKREAPKPTFRIRKGKKDITEQPDEAMTRRARFYNPEDSFGKKSLVYQARSGQLQTQIRQLSRKTDERPRDRDAPTPSQSLPRYQKDQLRRDLARDEGDRKSFRPDARPRNDDVGRRNFRPESRPRTEDVDPKDFRSQARDRDRTDSRSHNGNRDRTDFRSQTGDRERTDFRPQNRDRDRTDFRPRDRDTDRSGFRPQARDGDRKSFRSDTWSDTRDSDRKSFNKPDTWSGPRSPFPDRRSRASPDDEAGASLKRGFKETPTPVSIPYTTAASQFLYGKSVVEAALKSSRRKLYTLYIYCGANRQNVARDHVLEKLAQRMGIKTVMVDESGQRMLEKMSLGRPHNGYILEASPLPQQPLTSLGELTEVGGRPGYKVQLGHQSSEEALINGNADFVPAPSKTHRPLVLMLDQVLDPGNLGAILRTASFLGVNAVAISKKSSASLTPVALKASAGACEALTLFSIESPAKFLADSKEAGWKIYAAVPATSQSKRRKQMELDEVGEADPLREDPCVLVVGSEGDGLPRALKAQADYEINIPNHSGSSIVDSLNVSVATALLCSSMLKGQSKSMFTEREPDELGIW